MIHSLISASFLINNPRILLICFWLCKILVFNLPLNNSATHYKTTTIGILQTSSQEISLGLIRSDTMLETSKNCFQRKCSEAASNRPYCCVAMVEINTIASGFGHLGPSSRLLQRFQKKTFLILFWLFILSFAFVFN